MKNIKIIYMESSSWFDTKLLFVRCNDWKKKI